MLLAYIYRSITHRVHFLDKAIRDLFICAKHLFVEANDERVTQHGPASLAGVQGRRQKAGRPALVQKQKLRTENR
jgi:hypothetical protein